MLHITRRSTAATAATTLICGALLMPAVAPAKTVKFTITTGKLTLETGGKFKGTARGTFGRGTVTGTAVPPNVTLKLRVRGGTISLRSRDGRASGATVRGTFRLVRGTGRYKGIKGRGSFTGSIGTFVFKYKGTATY